MVTFLITSFIIVSVLVVAVYFWQKPRPEAESQWLPVHQEPRGLFSAEQPETLQSSPDNLDDQREKAEIIKRAKGGDKNALDEAHARDQTLYDEVLDLLSANATDPKLLSLISYVTRANLPVSTQLAARVVESWKNSPDRNGTAKALHVAALSNDAASYNAAVDAAMQSWREGRLPDASAQ